MACYTKKIRNAWQWQSNCISVAPAKQWAGNLLATVVEPVAYVRTFSVNLANVFNPSRVHYMIARIFDTFFFKESEYLYALLNHLCYRLVLLLCNKRISLVGCGIIWKVEKYVLFLGW
jgi:hypothetical protein